MQTMELNQSFVLVVERFWNSTQIIFNSGSNIFQYHIICFTQQRPATNQSLKSARYGDKLGVTVANYVTAAKHEYCK